MRKYIYIAIGILLLIGVTLYIGKKIGEKESRDKDTKTKIEYVQVENKQSIKKIDSLNKLIQGLSKKEIILKKEEVKIKEKAQDIILVKPENKDCEDLYNKTTEKIGLLNQVIIIKDSVESNLKNQIQEQKNIISLKDNIIKNKDIEISLIKTLAKPRDKKYSISIHVGTGAAITKNNNSINAQFVPVYVGIGISRNLISF